MRHKFQALAQKTDVTAWTFNIYGTLPPGLALDTGIGHKSRGTELSRQACLSVKFNLHVAIIKDFTTANN